jgi:hypothetical protein
MGKSLERSQNKKQWYIGIPEGEIRICMHSMSASVSLLVVVPRSLWWCVHALAMGHFFLGPRLFEW